MSIMKYAKTLSLSDRQQIILQSPTTNRHIRALALKAGRNICTETMHEQKPNDPTRTSTSKG